MSCCEQPALLRRRRRAAASSRRGAPSTSSGASRSARGSQSATGGRAHAGAPPTIGVGIEARAARSASRGEPAELAAGAGHRRGSATPTTPAHGVDRRRRRPSGRAAARAGAGRGRAGRPGRPARRRPRRPTSADLRGAGRPRASTVSCGRQLTTAGADAERHRRVAARVEEATRAARPRPARGARGPAVPARTNARCRPEPPQAQPGGPAPTRPRRASRPGSARLRSTRSSIETARAERARARGDEPPQTPLVVLVGAAARSARRPRPSSRRGRCRAGSSIAPDSTSPAVPPPTRYVAVTLSRPVGSRAPCAAVAELDRQAAVGAEPGGEDLAPALPVEARDLVPADAVDARSTCVGTGLPGRVEVVGDRRVGRREPLAGLRRVAAPEHGRRRRAVADRGEVARSRGACTSMPAGGPSTRSTMSPPAASGAHRRVVSWRAAVLHASTSQTSLPSIVVSTAIRVRVGLRRRVEPQLARRRALRSLGKT